MAKKSRRSDSDLKLNRYEKVYLAKLLNRIKTYGIEPEDKANKLKAHVMTNIHIPFHVRHPARWGGY